MEDTQIGTEHATYATKPQLLISLHNFNHMKTKLKNLSLHLSAFTLITTLTLGTYFTYAAITQQSTPVTSGDPITSTGWNNIVSDISSLDTAIDNNQSASNSVIYIRHYSTPANCPTGWTEAGYGIERSAGGDTNVRTCYRSDKQCTAMYLRHYAPPANCPAEWTEAAYGTQRSGGGDIQVRTCYKCN